MRVWDSLTGETLEVLEGHTSLVLSVASSSDGRRITSGSRDKSVRVWDLSTGQTLNTLVVHTESVEAAALSTDGRQFVSGPNDESVHVCATPTQQTSPRYIRQKTVDSSGYERHTGWLLSPQGKHYLMFVPLSAMLPDSSNILTLPQSRAASVDFVSSTLGPNWHNCYLL